MSEVVTDEQLICTHCGETCHSGNIRLQDNFFCCEGCRLVYQLLDKSGLCAYYDLNETPGINRLATVRKDKFAFLEDEGIQQQLVSFKDAQQTHVTFYLPQVHCSSCLYLLENLSKINPAVISSTVNFTRKEVTVVFNHRQASLRQVAELLTSTGYEPYISLHDLNKQAPGFNRSLIYRLGVAGFCFANIMLLSFPEYLGIEQAEQQLQGMFRVIIVLLALPVFFYSAVPFYVSGFKGLQHRYLNIDAPIALAIIVTFARSLYEVFTGAGQGYFDSLSGIVFFMLAGRLLQDKTYKQLSFDRDYTSYFPIAVTVLKDDREVPVALPDLKTGDTLLIHNDELVPADGILTRGKAFIDYSFVTGESIPVLKETGEIVYAGGRQTGGNIELLVVKEVTQSYLTSLWSKNEQQKKTSSENNSFVQALSRYFTYIVFAIAAIAATYWLYTDASKVWNVITAILIVACPCALLLSNTFTNGNLLSILARNRLYLRNAATIESVAAVNHIIFDKTGTLTTTQHNNIVYEGKPLSAIQKNAIASLAAQSNHPLSRSLAQHLGKTKTEEVKAFCEYTGKGIAGFVQGAQVAIGSAAFINTTEKIKPGGHVVYISFEEQPVGRFIIRHQYRDALSLLVRQLAPQYKLSVISGDQSTEKENLRQLFGTTADLRFNQSPEDKLQFIRQQQQKGDTVMMIGDGLNDAGALQQSDVGMAVTEDCNNFTPASDAILEAGRLPKLFRFIQLCRANKKIVMAAFILSIVYNIIGITFAAKGILSPLTCAILMPLSSVSIILLTFGSSNVMAKRLGLSG